MAGIPLLLLGLLVCGLAFECDEMSPIVIGKSIKATRASVKTRFSLPLPLPLQYLASLGTYWKAS